MKKFNELRLILLDRLEELDCDYNDIPDERVGRIRELERVLILMRNKPKQKQHLRIVPKPKD